MAMATTIPNDRSSYVSSDTQLPFLRQKFGMTLLIGEALRDSSTKFLTLGGGTADFD